VLKIVVRALKLMTRALEAPKGERAAVVLTALRYRTQGAHRYVVGATPVRFRAFAITMAARFETTHVPRCHVRGHANRYALGLTAA
jgi:hypothetical protein